MGCGNRKMVPKVQKKETQELGGLGSAAAQPIDLSHVRGDVRRAQVRWQRSFWFRGHTDSGEIEAIWTCRAL